MASLYLHCSWTDGSIGKRDEMKAQKILTLGVATAALFALTHLAAAQDSVMESLEKSGVQGACGPKLNKKESAEHWFAKSAKDGNIAPQRKLANEKPKGETVDYDTLIKSWPASPPKRASN